MAGLASCGNRAPPPSALAVVSGATIASLLAGATALPRQAAVLPAYGTAQFLLAAGRPLPRAAIPYQACSPNAALS